MFEIPSDMKSELVPLAWLLGNWEGAGVFDFPGAEKCNFGQEVVFGQDGGDFLFYVSRTWVLDDEGKKVRPLESETGYWRVGEDRKVDVVMVRDDGVAENWYGELAEGKPQIDLATDAILRTPDAPPYSAGKRLYGYVNGDLMWVGEKATPDIELRPYMSAQLKKVVDPSEWAKDIKDLPDDGVAFFR
ncbi:FABP family protein [Streptomyces polyrhachis]|uniref:Ferric nitrobindin-like protein n=1 Tax=Streptomyces polyrhachis TaxID=1282885 RepID=A0ABW2GF15_9ACTN